MSRIKYIIKLSYWYFQWKWLALKKYENIAYRSLKVLEEFDLEGVTISGP